MFARRFALPAALLLAIPALAQPPVDNPGVGLPADPPPPQVRIQVRTPSAVAPGKPIAYKLIVTNPATERAYKVKVRNPLPNGVTVGKTDPPHLPAPAGKELVWDVGEMPGGSQKVIELELLPNPGTSEVKNQAFVSSEYGQAVLTKIVEPKLKVEKTIAKSATAGEPVPVAVRVTNTSNVPVLDGKLTETITDGFRFEDRGDGRRGDKPEQRVWELGTIAPGQSKQIRYAVKDGQGPKLTTTSGVQANGVPPRVEKETETDVLTAALAVELAGPATVPGGQRGKYTVVAKNTGTQPLSDVKVVGNLPAGCTLKKVTNGGKQFRDAVEWTVPRLDAGEAYEVRFELDSTTAGRKTVRAGARTARGVEAARRETATVFEGTTLLGLRADAEPLLPAVGTQGMLTITVTNAGGEPARNVRLRVELPEGVRLVQTTPKDAVPTKSEVQFPVVTVSPGDPQKFTLTYQAEKPGIVYFNTTLEATGLGDRPLTKTQSVEIVPR